jgi:hypothetical protein
LNLFIDEGAGAVLPFDGYQPSLGTGPIGHELSKPRTLKWPVNDSVMVAFVMCITAVVVNAMWIEACSAVQEKLGFVGLFAHYGQLITHAY